MKNYKFKGIDYYTSIKGSSMKLVENIWCKMGYRNSDKIGYNMYLISKYRPSTVEEFFNAYINDFTTIDDPKHGRNLGMIETLAIAFKEDVEKNNPSISFPVENYMDIIILHAIVETWEGYKAEEEIRNILALNGNEIINCDDLFWKFFPEMEQKGQCFDSWSSIDIISATNGVINRLIQVKPITTFTSTHPKTIKDRLNFDKHNMDGIDFIKKYLPYRVSENIYVKYMIYHKNDDGTISWYFENINDEKKYDFILSELLDYNFINNLKISDNFDKIA